MILGILQNYFKYGKLIGRKTTADGSVKELYKKVFSNDMTLLVDGKVKKTTCDFHGKASLTYLPDNEYLQAFVERKNNPNGTFTIRNNVNLKRPALEKDPYLSNAQVGSFVEVKPGEIIVYRPSPIPSNASKLGYKYKIQEDHKIVKRELTDFHNDPDRYIYYLDKAIELMEKNGCAETRVIGGYGLVPKGSRYYNKYELSYKQG